MRKDKDKKKIFPVQVGSFLNEKEKLFSQMIYCLGYSATQAYRLAVSPSVSISSVSSLGCRLLQEPRIQRYIRSLDVMHFSFTVNLSALKYQ